MDSYLHHQARADPNAADVSGEPPLIEAACYGDLEASTWEEDFHVVLLDATQLLEFVLFILLFFTDSLLWDSSPLFMSPFGRKL